MVFASGTKLTAQALNDLLYGVAMTADVTVNNSTTLVNATGLVIPLSANATYGLDGWLHWTSNPTADIKFKFTLPASTTGFWTGIGPVVNTAPVVGSERKNYVDMGSVDITNALAFAGDDEFTSSVYISAVPRGYIVTGATAGNLQLQFAQNTADVSNTILRAGSQLRLTRLN